MKRYQVIVKVLPIFIKSRATKTLVKTNDVLLAGNTIGVEAIVSLTAPNGNIVEFAKFTQNNMAKFVKLAGLQAMSSAEGDADGYTEGSNPTVIEPVVIENPPVVAKTAEKVSADRKKLATTVFIGAVAAGVILPLIFAAKDKKLASAFMYGMFGLIVGGGISMGLSGKIKS